MKHILICAILCGALVAHPGFAAEQADESKTPVLTVSLGGTVHYAWWEPMFKNNYLDAMTFFFNISTFKAWSSVHVKPAPLYGPIMSITLFKRLMISSLFLMTDDFSIRSTTYRSGFSLNYVMRDAATSRIKRYDTDTSVTVFINKHVALFTGYKFQQYRYRGKSAILHSLGSHMIETYHTGNNAHGAGLGLILTVPIIDTLSLSCSLSGLYQRAIIDSDGYYALSTPIMPIITRQQAYLRMNVFGGNSTLNLSYFLRAASISFNVGFRYQMLRYYVIRSSHKLLNNAEMVMPGSFRSSVFMLASSPFISKRMYNGNYDHFYGLFFSAMYSFTI